MKSARRLVGVLCVLSALVPAAAFAASEAPTRLNAAARGQLVEAPGAEARAEVVTFGEELVPSLLRVSPDETVRLAGWPVAPGERADVRITRFEIYAPGARIWAVEADGNVEVPRSRMAFFRGTAEDDPETRIFIAVEPGRGGFEGLSISSHGTHEIRPFGKGRRHLVTVPEYFLPDAENGGAQPLSSSCGQSEAEEPFELERAGGTTAGAGEPPVRPLFDAVLSSLHTVTIAVDTDNELMLQKFSNNTTNATNYVAALIAAMNVIYERDLNIRLLQGTTFLRVSTTTDPYAQTGSGASSAQLNEFSNYWSVNHGAVQRGLAMMLSGKSSSANSSSGIAWITGLCSTSIGYSFTQVFKFAGSTGASDAFVVGHELGHNFGSPHTHCYSPPIDTCYVQGQAGCYSGATSCPAAATYNGVSNVRGTIMSYCHLLGGCGAANVFHPTSVDRITGIITPRIGNCVFSAIIPPTVSLVSPGSGPASGGTSVTITGTGFQSGATVSFGGTASPSVTFNGSTQLTATTPPRAAGLVGVTVTNPDTGSATAVNAFTFNPLPSISGLSPNSGTTAGGTVVTIHGANFVNGAAVTFGGSPVASTFVSSTQLSFTTPARSTGTVGILVTNPDTGSGSQTNAFFYAPPPVETDFYTLTPCRVLDTRNPDGPQGGPLLGSLAERSFPVAGLCGVPADAVSVVVNLTVFNPASPGELSAYPGNAFHLGTTVLGFRAASNVAGAALLPLATNGAGTIRIRNGSAGSAHVILDVTGYFVEP